MKPICPACEEDEVAKNCAGLCPKCYAEFTSEYNEILDSRERENIRLKVTGEIAA